MPTNSYSTLTFTGTDATVLATENAIAPKGLTMDLTYLVADSDGNKYVKAGAILAKLSSGKGRVLGLTRLTAAATVSSTTSLTVGDGLIFKASEALIVARPYVIVTFAATWANADTPSTVIDGNTVTSTVTTATLATCATEHAAAINANALASSKVEAYSNGALVYIFSKTTEPYTVIDGADGSAGNGTCAVSGVATTSNLMLSNVSLGAVHGSTAPTATTITMAAAASVTLPIGTPIGVYCDPNDIFGLTANKHLLASTASEIDEMTNDVAAYDEGAFYQTRLPYWDNAIAAALPKISLV